MEGAGREGFSLSLDEDVNVRVKDCLFAWVMSDWVFPVGRSGRDVLGRAVRVI
jgi:hypothetical protein